MSGLSTHILDTVQGGPAVGVEIKVFEVENESLTLLKTFVSNEQGRTDVPVLTEKELKVGVYQLHFLIGSYFNKVVELNTMIQEPPFLDKVIIEFGIASPDEHYHVPLLVSPYGYSTYRGS